MEDFLNINFIQADDSLFDSIDGEVDELEEKGEQEDTTPVNEDNNDTIEDNSPESVDSGGDKVDESPAANSDSSPNHISSIADALRSGGVFRTLSKEDTDSIVDEDSFSNAIEKEANNRLDEQQKRVIDALNYRVPVGKIQYYENTINVLNGINEDALRDESDDAENKRKNIIYQNYINKGIPEKEAAKLATLSVESDEGGMDEACEALEECKKFFTDQYNKLISDAKKESIEQEKAAKKRQDTIKKNIMESSELLKELEVNDSTRRRIYENISKPVHTKDDGSKQTAVQKYIEENPEEFWTNVSAILTMTDFFKNYEGLTNKPLKTSLKRNNDKLKNVLNTTKINDDGTLRYQRGVSVDDEDGFDINDWGVSKI